VGAAFKQYRCSWVWGQAYPLSGRVESSGSFSGSSAWPKEGAFDSTPRQDSEYGLPGGFPKRTCWITGVRLKLRIVGVSGVAAKSLADTLVTESGPEREQMSTRCPQG